MTTFTTTNRDWVWLISAGPGSPPRLSLLTLEDDQIKRKYVTEEGVDAPVRRSVQVVGTDWHAETDSALAERLLMMLAARIPASADLLWVGPITIQRFDRRAYPLALCGAWLGEGRRLGTAWCHFAIGGPSIEPEITNANGNEWGTNG